MWRRSEQQHVALFISDQALKEFEPLMSATLAAELAWGTPLVEAAQRAAEVTAAAIRHGATGVGAGAGPVAVGQASGASQRVRTR